VRCQPHVELSALEPGECCVDSYVHAVTPNSGALGCANPASLRHCEVLRPSRQWA
jgi:hypothetical protein